MCIYIHILIKLVSLYCRRLLCRIVYVHLHLFQHRDPLQANMHDSGIILSDSHFPGTTAGIKPMDASSCPTTRSLRLLQGTTQHVSHTVSRAAVACIINPATTLLVIGVNAIP